jgi:hypothetical protein
MNKILVSGIFLVIILSGCDKTEYVTVTDTLVVTETITTTSERNYSYVVGDALVLYITELLQERGLFDSVTGVGNGGDRINLLFDKKVNDEIVDIVQSAIDEIAPGFPLDIIVGTFVTKTV